MKKNKLFLMMAMMSIALTFNACKDDGDDEEVTPTPASTEQKLSFHIHNMVGNVAVDYTTQYTDASGRKFNLADCRYYISNIELIKSDNSILPLTGKVLLVNPTDDEYALATVPVGSYKGFKFMLGLDSATNHGDPSIHALGTPLGMQTPNIYWTWSYGYIFMKLQGQVDTAIANTGTPNVDYFYDIGTEMFARTIDFSTETFAVSSGADKEIVLKFNLLDALNNVDMRTERVTHSSDNKPLASKIADNLQGAFTVQ